MLERKWLLNTALNYPLSGERNVCTAENMPLVIKNSKSWPIRIYSNPSLCVLHQVCISHMQWHTEHKRLPGRMFICPPLKSSNTTKRLQTTCVARASATRIGHSVCLPRAPQNPHIPTEDPKVLLFEKCLHLTTPVPICNLDTNRHKILVIYKYI